jgi:transcription elongation factor GreA
MKMKILLKALEERRQELLEGLATATKAQFEADGKMQSRYDTQKEDAAQEVAIYEGLIADIDNVIKRLTIVEAGQESVDTVEIGRLVTIEFDDGDEDTLLILDTRGGVSVGDFQTLSPQSPVGCAILGKRVGETISVELPSGEMPVRIVAVES